MFANIRGYFNSIKVQLRLIKHLRVILWFLDFNSIKVQLRPNVHFKAVPRPVFQFHKGTIKTKNMKYLILLVFYFNSIKVQLRH